YSYPFSVAGLAFSVRRLLDRALFRLLVRVCIGLVLRGKLSRPSATSFSLNGKRQTPNPYAYSLAGAGFAFANAVVGCTDPPSVNICRPSTTTRSPVLRPSSMIQSLPILGPTVTPCIEALLALSTTQTKFFPCIST